MWYRFAVARIPLPNPVVGGFWIDVKEKNELGQEIKTPREIKEGQPFGIVEWKKLLSTVSQYINSQEKLDDYLSNPDRFVIRDGKRFYIPRSDRKLSNPIVGGFWVDEKQKNELGEIVTTPREIKEGQPFGIVEWEKLLSVHSKNFKSQEKLNNFLNNPNKFEIRDGKRFYIPFIPLKNPIEEGFWVDEKEKNELGEEIQKPKFIPYGKPFLAKEWVKLLTCGHQFINSQEKLNNFLNNPNKFVIRDGKRFYIPRYDRKLSNPVIGGFYLGDKPIPFGGSFGIIEWSKLLSTDSRNINEQEKLDAFLSDERRFEDKNGVKFYIPIKESSYRESLFEKKFNNYNRDSITIQSQENILISYIINNIIKKTILKLDFAFIKNNKLILAIEINGMQHYGFVNFSKLTTYDEWQQGLNRDILKINYCHNNNIPLLIFNHMLSEQDFITILNNLYKNPHVYDNFIPPSVIDENVNNTSIEFIKRQIYSHLYPVFNNVISFKDDESRKRYIKDTLILISKLMGIYEGGIDKTDYIRAFNRDTDLTSNYNICLSIYNNLYPEHPLDTDEKITYSDLSKQPRLRKEKSPTVQKPKTIEQDPLDN
jgi:hypothetical protein